MSVCNANALESATESFSHVPLTRMQWIKHLTIDFSELHLRANFEKLVRFLLVIRRRCNFRTLNLKLRFLHPFSFEAEPLKTLGDMLEAWEFGDARILLPDPVLSRLVGGRSHVALSNPPQEADFVTFPGDGAEQSIDEVIKQLMISPENYY